MSVIILRYYQYVFTSHLFSLHLCSRINHQCNSVDQFFDRTAGVSLPSTLSLSQFRRRSPRRSLTPHSLQSPLWNRALWNETVWPLINCPAASLTVPAPNKALPTLPSWAAMHFGTCWAMKNPSSAAFKFLQWWLHFLLHLKASLNLWQLFHTECDVVGQQMKPWKDAAAEPGPSGGPTQPGGGPTVLIPIRQDTFSFLAQKQPPTYGWLHHQDNTA